MATIQLDKSIQEIMKFHLLDKVQQKIQTEMEEKSLIALEEQMDLLYQLSDKNNQIVRLLQQSKSSQLLHQGQIRYLDLIKLTRKRIHKY